MSVYCDVNTLEDVTFIAGSTQIFEYEIMNAQTGEYVDISGCELEFA